jgi:FaeA-like protein
MSSSGHAGRQADPAQPPHAGTGHGTRGEPAGLLQVTGRDITEGEFAVTFTSCSWALDGGSLPAAAEAASQRHTTAGLGDRSTEIVRFISRTPAGVRAGDVAAEFGIPVDAVRPYLGRLTDAGRIRRAARGLYVAVTNVMSVTSTGDTEQERNTSNRRNAH